MDYYDSEGVSYASRTLNVDMTPVYEHFLRHLPDEAHILDAGCGSGRDTRYFTQIGYRVTAIDSSATMIRIASDTTGQRVLHLRFQDLEYRKEFDAIWACASLLHVPRTEINSVILKLMRSLRVEGIWYMSFKHGHGERIDSGRLFNDYTSAQLCTLLAQYPCLEMLDLWESRDERPDRDETWVNAIVRRLC